MVLPVLHEIGTTFSSLGKLVVGDAKGAGKVWDDYSKESVIGSGVRAAGHAIAGNTEEARVIACGMGRATGRALTGGGFMSELPVFKELDKVGKSLGDMIGGGDDESARKRWTEEYIQEYQDPANWSKAGVSLVTAGLGTGVTILTAGLATPAFVAAMGGAGAAVGTADNAAKQGIDIGFGNKDSFDLGEMVGSGLQGGVMAANAARAGRAAAEQARQARNLQVRRANQQGRGYNQQAMENYHRARQANQQLIEGALRNKEALQQAQEGVQQALEDKQQAQIDGQRLKRAGEIQEEQPTGKGTGVTSLMVDEDGNEVPGHNEFLRSKKHPPIKKADGTGTERSGNVIGHKDGPFPDGIEHVEKGRARPSVQQRLAENGGEQWEFHNCAEPHALENLRAEHPDTGGPKANYTVGRRQQRDIVVKKPCNNCNAMGEKVYGKTPFDRFDGKPFQEAIDINNQDAAMAFRGEARRFTNASRAVNEAPRIFSRPT